MYVHSEVNLDEVDQKAEMQRQEKTNIALLSPRKEMVLAQMSNIATIAALIGGFALSTLTSGDNILTTNETVPTIAMLLFYLSVHACTCSAVACFWIYRKVAAMDADQAMSWAQKRPKTLAAPAAAFAVGAIGYIVGVIFFTLDAVSDSTVKLIAVYVISAMCGSFLMTLGYTTM